VTTIMVRPLAGRGLREVHVADIGDQPVPPVFPVLCGKQMRRMHVEILPLAIQGAPCLTCMAGLPEWPVVDADDAGAAPPELPGVIYAAAMSADQVRHIIGPGEPGYEYAGRTVTLSVCGFPVWDHVRDPRSPAPSEQWPPCRECTERVTAAPRSSGSGGVHLTGRPPQ
jgi:hypothetical protein